MMTTAEPAPPPTILEPPFATVLAQWEREADHGTLDLGRYRSAYYAWGQGPALVFVHGLGDGPRSFVPTLFHLRRHFRCVAYQGPTGVGDGARLRGYRHADLVADLVAVLDQLGVPAATVIGHSFGSTVAVRALHDYPDRLPRGVLIAGFAHRPLRLVRWWMAQVARWLTGSRRLADMRRREEMMRRVHFAPFERLEPDLWRFFLETTGPSPLKALAHWALTMHGNDLTALLPAVRQPVLVIGGDADPLVPFAYQERLFHGLPNAALFQVTGSGHLPTLTHPRTTADALKRFLGAPTCQMECLTTGGCAAASPP